MSRGFGSASAFSLIIESYWSIESSSVFALSTTSRPKYSAKRFTPGIRERFGCQLSAQTPFSELTQTPRVGVDDERVVAVGVARRPDERDPLAELDVALEQDHVLGRDVLDAVADVPGPLHRVDREERVPLLALGEQLRVREERRARLGLAVDRLRRAEDEADVLDVEVVEADEVDVLGPQAGVASAWSGSFQIFASTL